MKKVVYCLLVCFVMHPQSLEEKFIEQNVRRMTPADIRATIGSVLVDMQPYVALNNANKNSKNDCNDRLALYGTMYQALHGVDKRSGKINHGIKRLLKKSLLLQNDAATLFFSNVQARLKQLECQDCEQVYCQSVIFELVMQMGLMTAQQEAAGLLTQEESGNYNALVAKIKTIAQDFQTKQKELSDQTSTVVGALSQTFTQQAAAVQAKEQAGQVSMQQELQYIQRLAGVTVPAQLLFVDQNMLYDVSFGASRMQTPFVNPWYNIFRIGDWAYDGTAFIQRAVVPGTQAKSVQPALRAQFVDKDGKPSASVAELNHIFTEIAPVQNNSLSVDVTILNTAISDDQNQYPFCVGILFNKPRWLSGNPDRMYTYRFVGLYGKSHKNVGLYAGQSTVVKADNGMTNITTPLSAIVAGTNQQLFDVSSSFFDSQKNKILIGKEQITFRLEITWQESAFTINLYGTDLTTPLYAQTVTNLDASVSKILSWYNGIGFMAPGCQARFKINNVPNSFLKTKPAAQTGPT